MLQLTHDTLKMQTFRSVHKKTSNPKGELNAFVTSSGTGFGAMSSYTNISNQLQIKTKQFALFTKKTNLKTKVIPHASLKMMQNLDRSIPMYSRILVSSLNSFIGDHSTTTAGECRGLVISGSK